MAVPATATDVVDTVNSLQNYRVVELLSELEVIQGAAKMTIWNWRNTKLKVRISQFSVTVVLR